MSSNIIRIRRRFKESNILFQSESTEAIAKAIEVVQDQREKLERYIILHPEFYHTLKPISIETNAPCIVKIMAEAGKLVNVGPMAAVAGALADLAVEAILNSGAEIAIIEDGGEVSASSKETFLVGLYAGGKAFSKSICFRVYPSGCPIGIATSSATISHAFSFGEADAATIFSKTSALADAAATAVCNVVQGKNVEASIQRGLEKVDELSDFVRGALIIRAKRVGIIGQIPQLVKINKELDVKQISMPEAVSLDTVLL